MPDPVPCPKCQRPNAAHKVRCLYCGEAMPNPTAPPPKPVRRDVPQDMDALVRNALRTGKLRDLSVALSSGSAPAASAPPPDVDEVTDPGVTPELAPVPPAEALAALLEQVAGLRMAEDAQGALDLLAVGPGLLEALGDELEVEAHQQARLDVVLPAFRFRHVLVAASWAGLEDLGPLSEASGLDPMTLRMRARQDHAQVVARADDRSPLEERAAAIRTLGLAALVLERASLEAIDVPPVLLRRGDDLRWWVSRRPLWQADQAFDPVAPPAGEALDVLDVTLAVPADVVVKRYRQSSDAGRMGRKREASARAVGESRVGVIDLHGPASFVRIVEGISDLGNLPGAVAGSHRRSLRGVLEQLDAVFPGARIVGRRVCQSADGAPSIRGGDALARTGWPQLEEHTRLVRLNHFGASV